MRKWRTLVRSDGKTLTRMIGWTAVDRLVADMQAERDKYSKLAQMNPHSSISDVVMTERTVVVVYEFGDVKVIHWTDEDD